MIHIGIIEQDTAFRRGLQWLIEQQEDMLVVGTSDDRSTALQLIAHFLPDLVLMDSTFAKGASPLLIYDIKRIAPNSNIILLTTEKDEVYLATMIEAGAYTALNKNCTPEEVIATIMQVIHKEIEISSLVAAQLQATLRQSYKHSDITPQEQMVLARRAQGLTIQEIAAQLHLKDRSVMIHLANIIEKIQAAHYVAMTIMQFQQEE